MDKEKNVLELISIFKELKESDYKSFILINSVLLELIKNRAV